MAFTRADATTYLANALTEALADAGIAGTDTAGDLAEVLDDAFLMFGTDYDDLSAPTVSNEDVLGLRKILLYAGLRRIYDAIVHRVDITIDGPSISKKRQQAVASLAARVQAAWTEAQPYVVGGEDFQWSSLNLDIIEPEAT